MHIRTIFTSGAVIGALIATSAALPAFAATSATITDPKGDVVTATTDPATGTATTVPGDYPAADIRKVKVRRTVSRLIVTIKVSLEKKNVGDSASVLIRTSDTKSAKYLITVSRAKPTLVLITSKSGIDITKKTITFHTKPGVDGTMTFSIDNKWFKNAKKVSVAALLTHSGTTTPATSSVDATGTSSSPSAGVKWTKFVSAKK